MVKRFLEVGTLRLKKKRGRDLFPSLLFTAYTRGRRRLLGFPLRWFETALPILIFLYISGLKCFVSSMSLLARRERSLRSQMIIADAIE